MPFDKITQTVAKTPHPDDVVKSTKEKENTLSKEVETFAAIKNEPDLQKAKEHFTNLKSHQIVKFVTNNPEKSRDMFLEPTGAENEWKVNFDPVDWELLGLGHFKAITEQFNQVSVNDRVGSLDINASKNKPGYSDALGYVGIRNGDTIKGITNQDLLDKDLITDFNTQADLKNEQYRRALEKDPNFYKTKELRKWQTPLKIKPHEIKIHNNDLKLQPGQLKASEALLQMNDDFIIFSSGDDQVNRLSETSTTPEGLRPRTIEGIKHLKKIAGISDKKLTATGLTEYGHSNYEHSHWNGYKMDIRLDNNSKKIEDLMKEKDSTPSYTKVGLRYTFEQDGYKFRIIKESNHLDIEVT